MPLSFLIQTSRDQRSFASFPGLIAGYHVFRRLSMPRHPPCTLSSLTTVTDHRPRPLGKAAAVRTADNGSDQSRSRGHSRARALFISPHALVPRSPKRCSTTPGQNGKDHVSTAGRSPRRKTKCRGSRILRGLPHGGIPADRPPKPSVEPLFTCQRTPDFSGPAKRGRVGRQ